MHARLLIVLVAVAWAAAQTSPSCNGFTSLTSVSGTINGMLFSGLSWYPTNFSSQLVNLELNTVMQQAAYGWLICQKLRLLWPQSRSPFLALTLNSIMISWHSSMAISQELLSKLSLVSQIHRRLRSLHLATLLACGSLLMRRCLSQDSRKNLMRGIFFVWIFTHARSFL